MVIMEALHSLPTQHKPAPPPSSLAPCPSSFPPSAFTNLAAGGDLSGGVHPGQRGGDEGLGAGGKEEDKAAQGRETGHGCWYLAKGMRGGGREG